MDKIKSNTFFLTISNTLQTLCSLLVSVVLARYFIDKEEFGKYQQILVIVNFIVGMLSGVPMGLNYFHGKYQEAKERVSSYGRFGITMLLLALVFMSVFIVCKELIAKSFTNSYIRNYYILISCFILFRSLNSFYIQFNLVTGKVKYHLLINIIGVILTVVGLWYIWIEELSIKEIICVFIGIEIVKGICFYPNLHKYIKKTNEYIVRNNEFRYIVPMTSITLISVVTVYIDKIMISSMLNPSEFAVYQVGAFSIPFIGIITGSIVTVLIPVLARLFEEKKNDEIIKTLRDSIKNASLFLLPILIYCILIGNHLIQFVYSSKYYESGIIFQIYTIKFILSVIAFSAILSACGLQKYIVYNSVINLVSNVILNFILIPIWGSLGAVYATLVSTFIGYVYPIYLMRKHMKASFLNYFPTSFYVKVFLISIIVCFPILIALNRTSLNNSWAMVMAFPYYSIVVLSTMGSTKRKMILNKIQNTLKR